MINVRAYALQYTPGSGTVTGGTSTGGTGTSAGTGTGGKVD